MSAAHAITVERRH